jgi:minor histocompatibility antigen H13
LGIMVLFNHAQPALLYLVPGVLISSTGTSIFKGEFKALWNFNEEKVQKEEFNKDKKENEGNDDNKDKKE